MEASMEVVWMFCRWVVNDTKNGREKQQNNNPNRWSFSLFAMHFPKPKRRCYSFTQTAAPPHPTGFEQNFFAKSKFNILLKVFYVFPRTGAKFAPCFGWAASAAGLAIWPPLVVSPKDKKKHTVFVGIAKIPTNPQTGCVGHTGFHQSRRKFSRPIWTFQDLTFSPGLGAAFLVRVCAKMQFTKPYGCLRRGWLIPKFHPTTPSQCNVSTGWQMFDPTPNECDSLWDRYRCISS